MTAHHKLIAGTVAVALLAGGGAALAAFELSSSSPTAATAVTAPPRAGIGSYGLGPGRLGGRGLPGGLGPGEAGVPGAGGGRAITAAAAYLGIASRTLRARLGGGATFAQLAREQGKSLPGLMRAIVVARDARKSAERRSVIGADLTRPATPQRYH